MADLHSSFSVLGLEPGVSFETVRQSYRHLVKTWHPDRFFHDPEFQRVAHQKLSAINRAYEELGRLFSGETDPAPGSAAGTGPGQNPPPNGFSAGESRAGAAPSSSRPGGKDDPPASGKWADLYEDLDAPNVDAHGSHPQAQGFYTRAYRPEEIWRYRQAAEQGFDSAQFELGVIYFQGIGVSRDLVEAYKWLALAADANGRARLKADLYLERVRAFLTREQVAEAASRMAPFKARHSARC